MALSIVQLSFLGPVDRSCLVLFPDGFKLSVVLAQNSLLIQWIFTSKKVFVGRGDLHLSIIARIEVIKVSLINYWERTFELGSGKLHLFRLKVTSSAHSR